MVSFTKFSAARRRLTYANITATLALLVAVFVAVPAWAILISGAQVKNGSLTGLDVKNSSLTGTDIRTGSVSSSDVGLLNAGDLASKVELPLKNLTLTTLAENADFQTVRTVGKLTYSFGCDNANGISAQLRITSLEDNAMIGTDADVDTGESVDFTVNPGPPGVSATETYSAVTTDGMTSIVVQGGITDGVADECKIAGIIVQGGIVVQGGLSSRGIIVQGG